MSRLSVHATALSLMLASTSALAHAELQTSSPAAAPRDSTSRRSILVAMSRDLKLETSLADGRLRSEVLVRRSSRRKTCQAPHEWRSLHQSRSM